jgi:glutathione S-transferase
MRVVWQCEEMGLPYRFETVSFPPSAAYRALNPLGSVPFLQDDAGVAINESIAMMLYLAQKYGPTPLLPGKDDPTLGCVLQMTVFGEAAIGAQMNSLLAAHFAAPEADKRNWSVRAQEARLEQAIAYTADILGDGPYLAGAGVTLADISVSCALGIWKGALGKPLPDKLVAYRERLAARPAYQRALKAHS